MNSLFGNKSSGIKPKKAVIRLERVSDTPPKPKPLASASKTSLLRNKSYEAPIRPANGKGSGTSSPARGGERDRHTGSGGATLQVKKRKAVRQMTPVQRMESDSEDDDTSSTAFEDVSIKRHRSERPEDLKRMLRSKAGFEEGRDGGVFEMIHAADISAAENKKVYDNAAPGDIVTVRLQYPSASQRER